MTTAGPGGTEMKQKHTGYHGTITKIEQQKHNAYRYNVYIDDRFAFGVHEDVLVQRRLFKGRQVDGNELKCILKQDEQKKLEQAGLRYLSYRPRTEWEIKTYLKDKGYASEEIHKQITHWQRQGYLDDRRFARQWIEERMQSKQKGRLLLAEELRRKGIEQTIIERSMQEADSCTEYEACLRLARKKVRSYRDEDALRRKHKLFRYLAGKGFEYDLIQEVWAELEHGPKEA
jgi:regulatory protein